MHSDRDFDLDQAPPPNEEALRQDLELDTLLAAMAAGDGFLRDVARIAILSSLADPEAIVYRQQILADCLEHPAIAREIYDLVVETIEARRSVLFFGYRGATPDTLLSGAVRMLELLVDALERLRQIADQHAGELRSKGFQRFFAMLAAELDDDYFDTVKDHLRRLRFRQGVLISARLGRGNTGVDYTLRRPNQTKRSWLERIPIGRDRDAYTFQIADRDEAGARALAELRSRGIDLVANALAQSTDHILSFFGVLRAELGFYIACLNLHERLAARGRRVCFPIPSPVGDATLSGRGIYDVCLSLTMDRRVVGNDLAADRKPLVMITGANEGGKSTFLRGLGLAQLMMQCGMFVAAESLDASVSHGVFTHCKREEDPTMKSGKLDEELARMSEIADHIRPHCLLLLNESFASTNEREGSEIARQIVGALLDRSIRVVFVTHLFELADRFHRQRRDDALFLRAEREPDGHRTFRLIEGEPQPTSYGEDLYRRIFGPSAGRVAAGASG
jgi:hypothetical protein